MQFKHGHLHGVRMFSERSNEGTVYGGGIGTLQKTTRRQKQDFLGGTDHDNYISSVRFHGEGLSRVRDNKLHEGRDRSVFPIWVSPAAGSVGLVAEAQSFVHSPSLRTEDRAGC